MCGFAGFWTRDGSLNEEDLLSMGRRIAHRGPDASSSYTDGEYSVIHKRLSILDPDHRADQPMVSADERGIIAYNGEIYNYQELARELGIRTRTTSDTEILLECLRMKDMGTLDSLNGMFSFAYYDLDRKDITLCRDRFGIKPLYYYHKNGRLVFASEIKAILEVIDGVELDHQALQDYLFLEYIPGPRTIFKDVHCLEPGCYARIDKNGGLEINRYYDILDHYNPGEDLGVERYMEELEYLLSSSVKYRLISDVPLGTFLSGGTDSSLVSAFYQRQTGQGARTYCIGFDAPEFDESPYAKAVSEKLGSRHQTYRLDDVGSLKSAGSITSFYDQPFAVPSVIPMLFLCENVRKEVKVALSGDGGDELFMGYGYYQWMRRLRMIQRISGQTGMKLAMHLLKGMGSRFNRASSILDHKNLPEAWLHVWSQEQYMFSEREIAGLTGKKYEHQSLYPYWQRLTEMGLRDEERISFTDLKYYLPYDLLYKVDTASMAYGLEVRLPFLDHRLVEFAINLPLKYKLRGKEQKILPKQVLESFLPPDLVHRRKWGFPAPVNHWLHKEYSQFIRQYLNRESLDKSGVFDPDRVHHLLRNFQAGRDFDYKKVWALISFQMWFEAYGQ